MEKPFYIKSFRGCREIADIMHRAGFEAKSDEAIIASLVALAHFLEEQKLTTKKLLLDGELRGGKSFELWSSDLTEQGLAVIRAGLGNWEQKGCPGDDIRPLERAYKKIRNKQKDVAK